jgi:hypothetical protein
MSDAETRQQMLAFFEYAMSPEAAGCGIELGNIWDDVEGWRTYIRVGDKAMAFNPGWGRKFARGTKADAVKRLQIMSAAEREAIGEVSVLQYFDDLESQCKETMTMRASGVLPSDVTSPTRGTS